jgi:hypothetical protein
MSDIHDTLERESARYAIRNGAFERMSRRRDRKQRNQRIAAIVVASAIAIGIVVVGSAVLRSAPGPQPADGTQPMLREGEVLRLADDGETLVATDTATGDQRSLARCTDCAYVANFAPSASGAWIAYEAAWCGEGSCSPDGMPGVWVAGAEGPPIHVTAWSSWITGPQRSIWAWSPTAEQLAFVDGDGKGPPITRRGELVLLDPATGERTTIVKTHPGISALAWSPDGTELAFADSSGLHIIDPRTGSSTSNDQVGVVFDMAWSPDGTRMMLDDVLDERNRILVGDADGSDLRVLLERDSRQGPGAPAWSPDGTRIAYVITRPKPGGGYSKEVWVMGADGSSPRQLQLSACCVERWGGSVWSPDGTHVAFFDRVYTIDAG